jgi:hypothetical protein
MFWSGAVEMKQLPMLEGYWRLWNRHQNQSRIGARWMDAAPCCSISSPCGRRKRQRASASWSTIRRISTALQNRCDGACSDEIESPPRRGQPRLSCGGWRENAAAGFDRQPPPCGLAALYRDEQADSGRPVPRHSLSRSGGIGATRICAASHGSLLGMRSGACCMKRR